MTEFSIQVWKTLLSLPGQGFNPFLPLAVSFTETTCLSLTKDDAWPSVSHVFQKTTLNEGMNEHHHFHFCQGHIGCGRAF